MVVKGHCSRRLQPSAGTRKKSSIGRQLIQKHCGLKYSFLKYLYSIIFLFKYKIISISSNITVLKQANIKTRSRNNLNEDRSRSRRRRGNNQSLGVSRDISMFAHNRSGSLTLQGKFARGLFSGPWGQSGKYIKKKH